MKVLEKFQNKKVFALYLVGVLLLSAGVSFAYFSANSSVTGSGSVATNTTATIESEGLVADGNISFSNTDIYPGHQAVASIKVTGTGENTPIIFNVIFNGNNTFNTPINYTIYKVESNIEASYSCEVREGRVGLNKIYYEECTGNNIEELGTSIGSGTITQGEGKTILKSDEIILTEPDGKEIYYYVVFEYPNEEANQNDDIGSIISGNITIEEGNEYTNPSVVFVGTTEVGNNGWYKSVNLTSNITTQTGDYDVTYCVTTEDSCTPNQTASIIDNSFTTTLSDSANPQKLCVRITDEYNQIGEGCSEAYKVDETNPSISITNTSATENSISVTISGSDTHSGIAQYRFSSDNGSSYIDINTSDNSYTYTFNNLESGTSYNISVQVVDEAGNVNTVTQVIETESISARDMILANYPTILTRTDFSTTVTVTTTGTIYRSANSSQYDDDGEVYYFAGNPTDNWVRFGGFYWRIIRINGDGSIRMIYQGTAANTTGTGTQIGTSAFNTTSNDNAYVGFKYTTGSVHGTGTDSTILTALNSWYSSNLASYASSIDGTAGFCGDRTSYTDTSGITSGGGTGSTLTYYGGFIRLSTNKQPTYECASDSDLYTISGSNKGNKSLIYPIGLITADEIAYAGGVFNIVNSEYYLNTNEMYWSMTPYSTNLTPSAANFAVSNGRLIGYDVGGLMFGPAAIRPVINLKADVTISSGNGTASNPYVIS